MANQPRVKTKEQIQRDNLKKTLTRLKLKVADMEELWLTFFGDATMAMLSDSAISEGNIASVVKNARVIADSMLDEYEDRWGKG